MANIQFDAIAPPAGGDEAATATAKLLSKEQQEGIENAVKKMTGEMDKQKWFWNRSFWYKNGDERLFAWAQENPEATEVPDEFSDYRITDLGALALCGMCPNLTKINCFRDADGHGEAGLALTDMGLMAIAAAYPDATEIELQDTMVTDKGIMKLAASCRNLTSVGLAKTYATDASAQALAANCPNLTAVRFGHTAISDVGVAAIAKACPVAEFDLNLCQNITNLGVQAIAEDCPDVTNIRLHSTKVTDIGIQAIASKCPKLASIRLGNTQITDVGAKALVNSCSLTEIWLNATNVSEEGVLEMHLARPEMKLMADHSLPAEEE